ncbi:MAG: LPS export ABC transporter periplasmic protein LptC [Pigmentiphaga sp.]|nr:LPS export ABC transporter periplasmic protein LptC [Pigmentiphaga sp.]
MKDRLATGISILLLMLLVAGTWWAASVAERSIMQDPPRRLTHEIDTYIDQFVLIQSDEAGVPRTRVEGDRLVHYPDDDSSDVTRFRGYTETDGNPPTQVSADEARMDQDGARITLNGNVRFQRQASQERPALTITSTHMMLFPDTEVAQTDAPATIVHGSSRIQGQGMTYNNVTRELQVARKPQVVIPAQGGSNAPPSPTRK